MFFRRISAVERELAIVKDRLAAQSATLLAVMELLIDQEFFTETELMAAQYEARQRLTDETKPR